MYMLIECKIETRLTETNTGTPVAKGDQIYEKCGISIIKFYYKKKICHIYCKLKIIT
jgi:hypothetical protein